MSGPTEGLPLPGGPALGVVAGLAVVGLGAYALLRWEKRRSVVRDGGALADNVQVAPRGRLRANSWTPPTVDLGRRG